MNYEESENPLLEMDLDSHVDGKLHSVAIVNNDWSVSRNAFVLETRMQDR